VRPNPLPAAHRLRSNLLLGPPFILAMAIFGTLALAASTLDKRGRLQHRIARWWAHASVFFSGSRLQVLGLENIPAEAAVFASNHTSYMDTPVVFAGLPFQFRILAKKELWALPFIGWYLSRSGQIPIDTANPRTTLSSFSKGVHTLRGGAPRDRSSSMGSGEGRSVFVFPEGGRTPDGELQSFLNGAAFLALRAQVPIVPVALVGVYDLLPIHTRHFYPAPGRAPIRLVFGPPIPTKGRSPRDSEALTEELRQSIDLLIQQNR